MYVGGSSGPDVQHGCYALSVRTFSSFAVSSGYDDHGLHYFLAPCSLLLAAGVPGFFVYPMWTLRCPKCGHWSLSFPFKRTGHYDEDGYLILECKKCQFRKRGAHKEEGNVGGGGDGF